MNRYLPVLLTIILLTLSTAVAQDDELFDINPDDFDPINSIIIDNEWLPMIPGTQHIYEGEALEEDEVVERRIIHTVTDLIKEINGINAVVVWERDFNDDELIEAEIAFFAQDNDGNVWHLGQYTEVYEEDVLVGGRIWLVGLPEGAKAGVFMWADPVVSDETYSQGFAPEPFNWTDRARISATGETICIELGCYENVLITEEEDDENPGAFQLKYYAPGVGNIGVGFRGDDPEEEELELVEIIELDAEQLEGARDEALALEQRGYMYGQTTPAQQR